MLPTATSPGESHRDVGSKKQSEEGEINMNRKGKRETEIQGKKTHKHTHTGAETVRLRRRETRERSNIMDVDSTTLKAAGSEWATGKPPARWRSLQPCCVSSAEI